MESGSPDSGSADAAPVVDAPPAPDADPSDPTPDAGPSANVDAPPPLPAIEITDCAGKNPVATIGTMGPAFVPTMLTIKAGETFKFTTAGRHNIASPPGAPADKTFDSGTPGPQEKCLTFRVAGVYPFVCTPHIDRGMIGTLTVE